MVSNPTATAPDGQARWWNRQRVESHGANHDALVEAYERDIEAVRAAGMTNLICFSGNRRGMDDAEGLKNCAARTETHHVQGGESWRCNHHGAS